MSIQLQDGFSGQLVDRVLEDLLARFLVNAPEEDLSSIERIFFQVEEAQWFYLDFVRHINPLLPSMKLKSFAPAILSKCPLIWRWGDPRDALSKFGKYKSTIPVRGIALMNKDLTKVLLVQAMDSGSWSFPRGKISKDESDLECAIREVREETGFDARPYVNDNDAVERTIFGKNMKIFLASGVPDDTHFAPLSRHEISEIKWFDLKSLPKAVKTNPQKFFAVDPILKSMIKWANVRKGLVDEEDLKREAEARLKALMGIGAVKENNDAGRELLNILQGTAQPDPQSQLMNPQSIQPFIPPQLQNMGFMQPPNAFAPPVYPPQAQSFPQGFMPMMPPAHLLPPQQASFSPGVILNQLGTQGSNVTQQPPLDFQAQQAQQPQQTQQAPQAQQSPQTQTLPQQTPQDKLHKVSEQTPSEKEVPKPPLHLAQYLTPLEPSAQSLSLPRRIGTAKNSKEFLSLLRSKPTTQSATETKSDNVANRAAPQIPSSISPETRSDRVITKDKIPLAATPFLSVTHREDVLDSSESSSRSNTPKKVTLLKREKDADASKTLLGLLGKNPGPASSLPSTIAKNTENTASSNPHASLYQQYREENPAIPGIDKQVSSPQPISLSASADLLGILKKDSYPPNTERELHKEKSEQPIRIAKKSTGTPIDLKTILAGGSREAKHSSPSVDSPSQSPGNAILEMLNRKSVTPDTVRITPQPVQPPIESFEDFEDFEDFDSLGETGTGLLRQSIAEDDIYDDFEPKLPGGLLQEGKSNGGEGHGAREQSAIPKPESYYDIYGTGDQTTKLQSHGASRQSNADSGASLLALLGRKPPQHLPKTESQNQLLSSDRNELLNLLKGGGNR